MYTYDYLRAPGEIVLTRALNEAGRNGWELVSVIPATSAPGMLIAFLKRPMNILEIKAAQQANKTASNEDGDGAFAEAGTGTSPA